MTHEYFWHFSFWLVLIKPSESLNNALQLSINKEELENPKESWRKKIRLIPGLMRYMVPLGSVYFFEYFINQGMVIITSIVYVVSAFSVLNLHTFFKTITMFLVNYMVIFEFIIKQLTVQKIYS